MAILATYWKPEACDQTALPDRSVLISGKIGRKCQNWKIEVCGQTLLPGQKLVKNAKIQMWHFKSFSNNVSHIS